MAFVCLIIKLTVICFCWRCAMAGKGEAEKGACLSLSEIVYSSILSQPRHLAVLLLLLPLVLSANNANGAKFSSSFIIIAMKKRKMLWSES